MNSPLSSPVWVLWSIYPHSPSCSPRRTLRGPKLEEDPRAGSTCLRPALKNRLSAHNNITIKACFPITIHPICLLQSKATLQISSRYGNQGIKTFRVL